MEKMLFPVFVVALALIGQACTAIFWKSDRKNEFTHFTSRASQMVVDYGAEVSLFCSVTEGYEDIQLEWWLVDYEIKLSKGSQLLIQSETHHLRYSKGSDGNCSATLTISSFQPSDVGRYACRFANSSGIHNQLSQLLDTDSYRIDRRSYDYEDMTECCKTFGVSGKCLELCSPFELFPTRSRTWTKQELRECGLNGGTLLALVECGSGRNNVACCLERNVSSRCSDFCSGNVRSCSDFASCSEEMIDVSLCLSRGLASIPPPVEEVSFAEIHRGDHHVLLLLRWFFPPRDHGGGDYDDHEEPPARFVVVQWLNDLGPSSNFKLIHAGDIETSAWNLSVENDSFARVSVVASGRHGASSQMTSLELRLLRAGHSLPPSASFYDCCKSRGIPAECGSLLCGSQPSDDEDNIIRNVGHQFCHPYYYGMLSQCLSVIKTDNRDCCIQRRVSARCLPLCSGMAVEPTLDLLSCLDEMPYVRSCLDGVGVDGPFVARQFVVSDVTCCSAVFSWLPVEGNRSLRYFLRYRELTAKRHFTQILCHGLTSASVGGLRPGSEYEAFVVVVLEDDRTLVAANSIRFWSRLSRDWSWSKESDIPTIAMQNQDPVAIDVDPAISPVPVGSRVTMNCSASLKSTCRWVGKSTATDRNMLHVWSAESGDSGVYTCICGKEHKSYTLNVQGAPTVVYQEESFSGDISTQRVVRRPATSHVAELACHFLGFPDAVAWYKDGRKLTMTSNGAVRSGAENGFTEVQIERTSSSFPPSSRGKYASTKYSLEDQGALCYKLSIEPFEPGDVGTYTCVGSNGYASDSGSLLLTTDDSIQETNFLKQHHMLVSDCCMELKVSNDCIAACSFEVDVDKLLGLDWKCHKDFNKIMSCSSRGWNYSSCCSEMSVPEHCSSLCEGGEIPSKSLAHGCINYASEILACHARGHSFTPPPVLGVNISTLGNGLLVVSFLSPVEKLELVSGYYVNWTSRDYPHLVRGHQVLSLEVQPVYYGHLLEPFQSYTFTVQSYNRHSFSSPCTLADILVREPPILERLKISLQPDRDDHRIVMIAWREEKYEYVEKFVFAIYDGSNGSSSGVAERREVHRVEGPPSARRALAVELEAGRGYFVVGWMMSSNYEGPQSDAEYIFIPGTGFVGSLVWVVLVCLSAAVVIVVVAWAVVGIKFRRKKTLSQDSVTFENSAPMETEADRQINIPSLFSYREFENYPEDDRCQLQSDRSRNLCL